VTLSWLYSTGFPKSLDVSKALDRVNGEGGRLHKFTAWMRTTGLKAKQIDGVLRSQGLISPNSNFAVHYFNDGQPAIPTAAMWRVVRPLCREVPPWVDSLVERIEAEREVIGTKLSSLGGTVAAGEHDPDFIGRHKDLEFAVTAPATDAAKRWSGWGTLLKPSHEPILLFQKPHDATSTESADVTPLPDETTRWVLHNGDSLEVLKTLPDASVDSVVCDPPYGLSNHSAEDVLGALRAWLDGKPYLPKGTGFMGKGWDSFVPGPEIWRECFRVLKPGGHLLAFAGTRTQDLMGVAIRLAGFDCRDEIRVEGVLGWHFGSGFPKSKNVALSIDKGEGLPDRGRAIPTASTHLPGGKYADEKLTSNAVPPYEARTEEAQAWEGWGTALKPAHEPVLMYRKPLSGTVAQTVQQHGTGAINIDGCRVETSENLNGGAYKSKGEDEDSYQCIDPNCPDAAAMPYHDHPSEKRKGRHDGAENWRYKHGGAGGFEQPMGRWPSNLVLCHTPDCKQVGTKKVKANSEGSGKLWSHYRDGTGDRAEAVPARIGDEDGTETVTDWECADGCPVKALDEQGGDDLRARGNIGDSKGGGGMYGHGPVTNDFGPGDSGGASRFFPQFQYTAEDAPFRYVPKTSRSERHEGLEGLPENNHPTVKPIELMRWLVRLVTQPGGVVLDPFNGSGSTGCAAVLEGMRYVGIELDPSYVEITRSRITHHELKSRGGVRNPWAAPVQADLPEEAPVSMNSLFGFDD
jgi:DNA modification methylase